MEVIDSAIRSISKFIRGEWGGKGVSWWLNALKEGAWVIYEGTIPAGNRYPIKAIAVIFIPKWSIPRPRKH